MVILYFSPIAYDFLKQRPQYLAEYLSCQHEVYYIEPTISWIKYALKGGTTFRRRQFDVSKNFHVYKLDGRFTLHHSADYFDPAELNQISERFQLRKLVQRADLIWIGYAGWYQTLYRLCRGKKIVYDKMDDNVALTEHFLMKKTLQKSEARLQQDSCRIYVSARQLIGRDPEIQKKTVLVPNAVSESFYDAKTAGRDSNHTGRIFGYVGVIGHWFDIQAIRTILEADLQNRVVLVGPNYCGKIEHPRVTYYGTVTKDEVPEVIAGFDVCIYPFKQDGLLDTINPVKIYEYLAVNKPVIAVESAETRLLAKQKGVYCYRDYEMLQVLSKQTLNAPFAEETQRRQFISDNCWDARGQIVEKYLPVSNRERMNKRGKT